MPTITSETAAGRSIRPAEEERTHAMTGHTMKQKAHRMKRYFSVTAVLIPVAFLLAAAPCARAQGGSSRDVIMRAMRDELHRNMSRLSLENMERPFFISYTIFDVTTLEITAGLGEIVKSRVTPYRNHNVRVMVGDYSRNDENFRGSGSSARSSMIRASSSLPLEDDYDGIRRALWVVTDNTYKSAAELFEHKKAALKQQTPTGETMLDDFSKAPAVSHTEPPVRFDPEQEKWERAARELSGLFRDYPDIYSSQVRIFFYQGDMLLVNSEGSEVILPMTLATVQANAYTQAVDGEPLNNHVSWHRLLPDDLPPLSSMKNAVKEMAEELIALRDAPVFDDSYFGPVMFEGEAAAEFFSQRLFSGRNGLIAHRRPISGNTSGYGYRDNTESLDDRMNRRILSRDLTVTALPGLAGFDGRTLIGSFAIDTEGVIPPSELVLVENGILKTLLNNRTPTLKVHESNGHQRPVIGGGRWTSTALGPGVVSVTTSAGKSRDDLKRELIRRAREEGVDYGILVRTLKPRATGAPYYDPMVRMTMSYGGADGTTLTEPLMICRVHVEDGREEPIRSVALGSVSLSTLRHIVGVSKERFVYNTLATSGWNSGIPASFIVPRHILLEELEVKREKRNYTPKLPAVPSPLAER